MGARGRRHRRRSAAAAGVALAVGVGGAAGLVLGNAGDGDGPSTAAPALTATLPPPPANTRSVPQRASPPSRPHPLTGAGRLFGFSDSTFFYTGFIERLDQGITPERQVADLLAAGANAARVQLSWYDLEPEPGQVNQAYVQRVKAFTDRFEAAGGRVLLVLGIPPSWARADHDGATAAIADRPDAERAFARMAALVARTWPRAAGIETWNEPNAKAFWEPRRPEPERFARLHQAAAAAIREAAPSTPVVLAGLAQYVEDGDDELRAGTFLRRMYAAGLRPQDYDAVAVHPYPVPQDGRPPSLQTGLFQQLLENFRRALRAADAGARIWITETGATTTGDIRVDPADQARLVVDLVRTLAAEPRVDAIFVHTLYDPLGFPERSKESGYGVLRVEEPGRVVAKPAYCAVRRLARRPAPTDLC